MQPFMIELSLFSAALAARRDDVAETLIRELKRRGGVRETLREAAIQTMLHDGYATALEGALLLQRVWPGAPEPVETGTYEEHEIWTERGRILFDMIYGEEVGNRLIENVSAASPELANWMITEGYGKVLSRGGLDTATRELCTLAVLVIKQRPRQLTSHLRGALRSGVARDDIEKLLARIERDLDLPHATGVARQLLTETNGG